MNISVISPFFNEEESLPEFLRVLYEQLELLSIVYEVILVNDGSTDNSLSVVKSLGLKHLRIISLSENCGHQTAIEAGYKFASGDWVVTLDSDLQHPPNQIKFMLAKAIENQLDVVHAKRINRSGETLFKRSTAQIFYKLINFLSGVQVETNVADFRLVSRKVVTTLNDLSEPKILRLLIPKLGFRSDNHLFEVSPRFAGTTKYSLKKMIRLALDSAFNFGILPLRLSLGLGLLVVLLSMVYFLRIMYMFVQGSVIPGWTSIVSVVLLIGGVQLISIGIVGEYLGRLFLESKKRPHFTVFEEFST